MRERCGVVKLWRANYEGIAPQSFGLPKMWRIFVYGNDRGDGWILKGRCIWRHLILLERASLTDVTGYMERPGALRMEKRCDAHQPFTQSHVSQRKLGCTTKGLR
jgi:hypothetical protein